MPTNVSWNNQTYEVPNNREPKGWGSQLSSYLIALANAGISLAGGTRTLTADLNFGATYGLVAKYIKSVSSNIAQSGVFRLANNESIAWRNNANNADIELKVDNSDQIKFNGQTFFANPMTTSQDIIVGGSGGAPTRLAKGSNNTYLVINNSGNVAYESHIVETYSDTTTSNVSGLDNFVEYDLKLSRTRDGVVHGQIRIRADKNVGGPVWSIANIPSTFFSSAVNHFCLIWGTDGATGYVRVLQANSGSFSFYKTDLGDFLNDDDIRLGDTASDGYTEFTYKIV